jgi:KUP system potassium uptake protein
VTAIPAAPASGSHALPLTATIGALGVVYGDIGTSPLYALKEAAKAQPMAARCCRRRFWAWCR